MKTLPWIGALALVAGIGLAGYGVATADSIQTSATPRAEQADGSWRVAARQMSAEDVEDRIEDQGYESVVVAHKSPPYTTAYGCIGRDDFRLTLSENGDVVDRERVGRCGGKESVSVRAPFTRVDTKNGDTHVRAPFADVDVDKKGVRVRAPFVDLNIPR